MRRVAKFGFYGRRMLLRSEAMSDSERDRLSPSAVRHIAKLARLRLDDRECDRYREQLGSILGHISMLDSVDIADVEPMAHPLPLVNRLGEDVPGPALPLEALRMNAPAVEGRHLAVPKVLAESSGG